MRGLAAAAGGAARALGGLLLAPAAAGVVGVVRALVSGERGCGGAHVTGGSSRSSGQGQPSAPQQACKLAVRAA
jgi:hypothetical protein